jgi:hypothetical protein
MGAPSFGGCVPITVVGPIEAGVLSAYPTGGSRWEICCIGAAKVKTDPGSPSGRQRLIYPSATDPAAKLDELSELLAKSLVDDS